MHSTVNSVLLGQERSVFKEYKFALLWGEAQLCLPCLLIEKKVMTYSDPMVTYCHPKKTYSYPKVT